MSELCSKWFRPVWTGFLTNLYNRQPVAVAVLPNLVEKLDRTRLLNTNLASHYPSTLGHGPMVSHPSGKMDFTRRLGLFT